MRFESVDGASLLDVDPWREHQPHRGDVVGSPDAAVEAANSRY